MRQIRILPLVGIATLAACGGGGGGTSAPPVIATPAPTPTQTPTPTPTATSTHPDANVLPLAQTPRGKYETLCDAQVGTEAPQLVRYGRGIDLGLDLTGDAPGYAQSAAAPHENFGIQFNERDNSVALPDRVFTVRNDRGTYRLDLRPPAGGARTYLATARFTQSGTITPQFRYDCLYGNVTPPPIWPTTGTVRYDVAIVGTLTTGEGPTAQPYQLSDSVGSVVVDQASGDVRIDLTLTGRVAGTTIPLAALGRYGGTLRRQTDTSYLGGYRGTLSATDGVTGSAEIVGTFYGPAAEETGLIFRVSATDPSSGRRIEGAGYATARR